MDSNFLEKVEATGPLSLRRPLVDDDEELSVRTQCRLPGLTRSTLSYEDMPGKC